MCINAHNLFIVGNTRVIGQSALQTFQEEMGKVLKDPYKVCVILTQEDYFYLLDVVPFWFW